MMTAVKMLWPLMRTWLGGLTGPALIAAIALAGAGVVAGAGFASGYRWRGEAVVTAQRDAQEARRTAAAAIAEGERLLRALRDRDRINDQLAGQAAADASRARDAADALEALRNESETAVASAGRVCIPADDPWLRKRAAAIARAAGARSGGSAVPAAGAGRARSGATLGPRAGGQ